MTNQPSNPPISAQTPAETALATVQAYATTPAGVVNYRSRGYLIVLGGAAEIETILDGLSADLTTYVVMQDSCQPSLLKKLEARQVPVLDSATEIEIEGFLGAFRVSVRHHGQMKRVDRCFGIPEPGFDLVLDLLTSPAVPQPIPPAGYFTLGVEPKKWKTIAEQLPDWVGEFDKPKYFEYTEAICAHSACGIEGCRLCIDVCDTGAIHSENLQLRINPNLCQGCGDCTTICPSGAIRYAYPQLSDNLNRIRLMLAAYAAAGGKVPVLLLHDARVSGQWLETHASSLPINVLPYELESVSAAGMDIWLAALAYGAEQVLLLDGGHLSVNNRRCLEMQLEIAGRLLNGMGYSGTALRIVKKDDLLQQPMPLRSNRPAQRAARFAGVDDKRRAIRLAADHLLDDAPVQQHSAALADGASFGTLSIDPSRCTLCLDCVSVCPEAALLDGGDRPQLKIIEVRCVQCGLCAQTCPEDAITLVPRYLYDSHQAREPQLLNEDAPFHCIQCGKPFATETAIRSITEKLREHPMFQGDKLQRLQLCEECRVTVLFDAAASEPGGHER
jgi:ferredoxin